jgi:hypothetical protein
MISAFVRRLILFSAPKFIVEKVLVKIKTALQIRGKESSYTQVIKKALFFSVHFFRQAWLFFVHDFGYSNVHPN